MAQRDYRLQLRTLFEALNPGTRGMLGLDYDGTLAPFHTDRHAAVPYPGVRELLHRILATGRTRVVLISGRSPEEVRSLLDLAPSPEIWGVHGQRRLRPDGHTEVVPLRASDQEVLREGARRLEEQGCGRQAECKPGSLAVHWRGLPPEEAGRVHDTMLAAWTPLAERGGMSLLEFDGGIELRPAEPNKGSVVRTLLRELEPGTPFAYLGDDLTDEDAFRALVGSGALTVLVRPEWKETQAQIWIRPPDELLHFLEEWLAWSGRSR